MSDIRKRRKATVTYCRSYLVTLGLAFGAVAIFVWHIDGDRADTWWAHILLFALFFGGLVLIGLGLFGPSKKMERWADSASTHWASLIIMVLAYPVYMIMSRLYKEN